MLLDTVAEDTSMANISSAGTEQPSQGPHLITSVIQCLLIKCLPPSVLIQSPASRDAASLCVLFKEITPEDENRTVAGNF